MKKILWYSGLVVLCMNPVWVRTSETESDTEHNESYVQQIKDLFIDKVAIPLYVQYDRMREEGISREDLMVAGLGALTLYGVKKSGDHYHMWSSIRKFDFKDTREAAHDDAVWLYEHKGKVAWILGGAAVLAWIVKTGWNLPIIERFRRSLTGKQKELISSDNTLQELIDNAHEDPTLLHEHDELLGHLHDDQKDLLDRAVQKHLEENDPFSLFDKFDYTEESEQDPS